MRLNLYNEEIILKAYLMQKLLEDSRNKRK